MRRFASPTVRVLLVGLKAAEEGADEDLPRPRPRQVSAEEARQLAATMQGCVGYVECSSRTGHGVEQAVCLLLRDLVLHEGHPLPRPTPATPQQTPPARARCNCAIL